MVYLFFLLMVVCLLIKTFWPLLVAFGVFCIWAAVRQKQEADAQYEHDKSVIFRDPAPSKTIFRPYSLTTAIPEIDGDAFSEVMNMLLDKLWQYVWIHQSLAYYCDKETTFSRYLRDADRQELASKISALRQDMSDLQNDLGGIVLSEFCEISWDERAFEELTEKVEDTQEFNQYGIFHRLDCSCIHHSAKKAVFLLPQVVVEADHENRKLKASTYENLNVELKDSKRLIGERERDKDDEIIEITYLYTKKDGSRDLRYSFENNPTYYYVYTGHLFLSCDDFSIKLVYSNRKTASAAYEACIAYKKGIAAQRKPQTAPEPVPVRTEKAAVTGAPDSLLNRNVVHCVYGEGKITGFHAPNYYTVMFDGGERTFTTSIILNKRYFTVMK